MIGLTFYFTKFFFSCDGNNPLLLVSSSKRQLCVKCGRQRKSYSFLVFPPEELNNEERLQLERRKSMTISFLFSVFSSMLWCDNTTQPSHSPYWTLVDIADSFLLPWFRCPFAEDVVDWGYISTVKANAFYPQTFSNPWNKRKKITALTKFTKIWKSTLNF